MRNNLQRRRRSRQQKHRLQRQAPGGGGCLLLATLLGLPVSTTHTRTAALLGAGSTSGRRIDWSVARSIALTWVLTFPGCFTLGWCMARLFLAWV